MKLGARFALAALQVVCGAYIFVEYGWGALLVAIALSTANGLDQQIQGGRWP